MSVTSFEFIEMDLGGPAKKKEKPEIKKWEIWIGSYHLGQGYDPPTRPEKIAEVNATTFRIACVIHEHQSAIDNLIKRMERGDDYIEDAHFGGWHYIRDINGNNWIGKYYESEEQAWESFKK